jgi:hypothetical protein
MRTAVARHHDVFQRVDRRDGYAMSPDVGETDSLPRELTLRLKSQVASLDRGTCFRIAARAEIEFDRCTGGVRSVLS